MNTKKPGIDGFSGHFRKLTTAADSSNEAAQANLEATLKARAARLRLIRDHIKAGGKISSSQKIRLSFPEQAFVEALELGNDPDLKETLKEIEVLLASAAKTIVDSAKGLWERFKGK